MLSVIVTSCPQNADAESASQGGSDMPGSCRHCPEYLLGCVMVECARCGKVLCRRDDSSHNVEYVGVVCDECYFDLCECGDNNEE